MADGYRVRDFMDFYREECIKVARREVWKPNSTEAKQRARDILGDFLLNGTFEDEKIYSDLTRIVEEEKFWDAVQNTN